MAAKARAWPEAQGEVRIVIKEFVLGGPKPTCEQLNRMDETRHLADQRRLDLDGLLVDLMMQ